MTIKFPIMECKNCCRWAASGYQFCWNCMPEKRPAYSQALEYN